MYWMVLVNLKADPNAGIQFEDDAFIKRFGDEAKFRIKGRGTLFQSVSRTGLFEIVIYDVEVLPYKNMDHNSGSYQKRCDDDVIKDIRDHLFYCGHDVIGCQRYQGVP